MSDCEFFALTKRAVGFVRSHLGDDAEDLVQQVWTAILRRGPAVRTEGLEAYFWASLRNGLISEVRKRRRRPQLVPLDQVSVPAQGGIEEQVLLGEVLAHLPPNAARALGLRAAGWSTAEIGQRMVRDGKGAANDVYRARQRARGLLRVPACGA